MFAPDNPLAPPSDNFAEPWQASTLAMAAAMVREGRFSQAEWAAALGAALKEAEASGAADTDETYFLAALSALEQLSADSGVDARKQANRKAAWEEAYRRTPHGEPVQLEEN
ncbi:MAG: nitrile hydratase accessory protein [Pseudomonadota bacterium]